MFPGAEMFDGRFFQVRPWKCHKRSKIVKETMGLLMCVGCPNSKSSFQNSNTKIRGFSKRDLTLAFEDTYNVDTLRRCGEWK
mmetsp:Transcript_26140/g.41956  ORF Transcript_26140/g.41956 Transcript_26140/m.41956 type:complete len:82 (+) Transcript_26140:1570-1815(+)